MRRFLDPFTVGSTLSNVEPEVRGMAQQQQQQMCDVCGIRPAVGTIRVVRPGRPPEGRAASSGFGGGPSLFDDFFSRFFGDEAPEGFSSRPRRAESQVEQVDVTERFSDATRELLQRAAQTAVEWGSLDLDTEHLLHAALSDDVVVHVLEQVGADPKSIAAQIEDET
jgi:ATP-dependent Clp protease ATP-binding subunit ClpC